MIARFAPRSVLGLGIVAIVTAAIVIAGVNAVTIRMVHHEIERQLDHRIELETTSLQMVYRNSGFDRVVQVVKIRDAYGPLGITGYLADLPPQGSGMGYIVVDAAGRRVAGKIAADMPPPGWSEFLRFRRADGSAGKAQAMNVALGNEGRLVVFADRAAVRETDRALKRMFAVEFILVLLILAATVAGFGQIVRLRLASIRDSARAIMDGDLSRRMPAHRGDSEFDELAVELNRMLDRITALMENLRQVSSDIAHDLRTPLTRLRHSIELAAATTDPALYRERLDAALEEADDALDLFAGLLAISEVEGQASRTRFRPVRLAEAIRKIADAYEPALETARVSLAVDLETATVSGDEILLQRAVANLLDNLIAHTPAGTRATLRLRRTSAGAVLSLSDTGPGIAAADQARVFERLVRLRARGSGMAWGSAWWPPSCAPTVARSPRGQGPGA
ncbi:MAG: HAMP domain-containing protein [Phenylobacterium sp.]|nr:ATP-binding protein [Phenylobacterium sp.]MBX3484715.1 HAMP domain-containing protein [Phenylobacterium sp.]MCW5758863.1 HAMP domain-containing protein [Phenylobacterium sp.]